MKSVATVNQVSNYIHPGEDGRAAMLLQVELKSKKDRRNRERLI
jgi:hypothetical protein